MGKKVAVVLSGCGYLDGAEIRESVITLLALDKAGADVSVFAPDIPQRDVINHLTNEPVNGEQRNVLVEAARIARGDISDLADAKADDFDALIIPGGFGVAKNLSSLATDGKNLTILPEFKRLILAFLLQKKPIGAVCISPAVLVSAVRDEANITVTIGNDEDCLISEIGGTHQSCEVNDIVVDDINNIVSTPAYMLEKSLSEIAEGIEKLVNKIAIS